MSSKRKSPPNKVEGETPTRNYPPIKPSPIDQDMESSGDEVDSPQRLNNTDGSGKRQRMDDMSTSQLPLQYSIRNHRMEREQSKSPNRSPQYDSSSHFLHNNNDSRIFNNNNDSINLEKVSNHNERLSPYQQLPPLFSSGSGGPHSSPTHMLRPKDFSYQLDQSNNSIQNGSPKHPMDEMLKRLRNNSYSEQMSSLNNNNVR